MGYEPVAYDKSIVPYGNLFKVIVRMDDEVMEFLCKDLPRASALLAMFDSDVCENDVPWSVFYSVDDRPQTHWLHAKLEAEDAQLC